MALEPNNTDEESLTGRLETSNVIPFKHTNQYLARLNELIKTQTTPVQKTYTKITYVFDNGSFDLRYKAGEKYE